jgi:hypothetical protein
MKTLRTLCTPRSLRLALLLLALVAVSASMLPAPSLAVTCCGYTVHYIYYTDASHTTTTGNCTYNEACTGAVYCSGTKTGYYTTSSTCCPRCSE